MNWIECMRATTAAESRRAVWVTWDEARPHVWVNDGVVMGDIQDLVKALESDPELPEWFADCDEVVFPRIGVMFLGPVVLEQANVN